MSLATTDFARRPMARPDGVSARARPLVALVCTMALAACGGGQKTEPPGGKGEPNAGANLTGAVTLDGSSTVFPISEAVAEDFQKQHPNVRVTVGVSGTGGGFKKFCAGETDINNASRPIKLEEIGKATETGIEFIELPVAFDGLSVVVNPNNTFVDHLTPEELRRIWQPESTVKLWRDVRPAWPAEPIHLYGPGHDSGTFDYFTEAINGKSGASRTDFSASEDDNTLVQGIEGDPNALGYFGFAYYKENAARLKIVPIDGGHGPITPSEVTINDGSYQPLSRPVFIYVTKPAASRPEVQAFVSFYLRNAPQLVSEVGYVPLPERVYQLAAARFESRTVGSVYKGQGAKVGVRVEDLFATGT